MTLPATGSQKVSMGETTAAPASPNLADSDILQKPKETLTDTDLDLPQSTWLQRSLLLSAIRVIGIYRHRNGGVLMLTKDLCVKYGSLTDLVEAQTMIYIATHTTIPVPKVHLAFTHKGRTYILMERIHGHSLGRGWLKRTPASRLTVSESLKRMILELRTLQKPSGDNLICSVTGGSLYDPRMPCVTTRYGPFKDVREFHDYLRDGIQAHSNHNADVTKLIDMHNQDWDAPTFTHSDLSSLNILARGDELVGIVDWETTGWYPAYWEYTTACQVNPQNTFWKDYIDGFLEPMPDALAMEKLRQQYFGDF